MQIKFSKRQILNFIYLLSVLALFYSLADLILTTEIVFESDASAVEFYKFLTIFALSTTIITIILAGINGLSRAKLYLEEIIYLAVVVIGYVLSFIFAPDNSIMDIFGGAQIFIAFPLVTVLLLFCRIMTTWIFKEGNND